LAHPKTIKTAANIPTITIRFIQSSSSLLNLLSIVTLLSILSKKIALRDETVNPEYMKNKRPGFSRQKVLLVNSNKEVLLKPMETKVSLRDIGHTMEV